MISPKEVLIKLNIDFNEKGDRLISCCPFHNEKTPSFSMYSTTGNYVCFGCGEKGSLNEFVQKLTNETIYDFFGIKQKDYIPIDFGISKRKLIKKLSDFELEGELLSVEENQFVLDYCWSIGLTNDFIKKFNITYSKAIGINHKDTSIDKKKTYYNRLIFPCLCEGFIHGYELRDYTKKSSKKVLYPVGFNNDILFNYDYINPNETVYIVEGIKALSKVWSLYSKNVVSTFGKVIKDYQKILISKLPKICVIPDNDENKINPKTGKVVNNIEETLDCFDSFYPFEYEIAYIPYKGKDPNDLTRQQIKEVINSKQYAKDIILNNTSIFQSNKLSTSEYLSLL